MYVVLSVGMIEVFSLLSVGVPGVTATDEQSAGHVKVIDTSSASLNFASNSEYDRNACVSPRNILYKQLNVGRNNITGY